MPSGKSWKVLDFFLKIPGPGKSWKLQFKVLESPGKKSWKLRFFIGSNGKQAEIVNVPVYVDFYLSSWLILPPLAFHILLHATVSAMDYTLNVVSKRCFFFIFKHSWASKRSWKISRGGPGKSWKSPAFFFPSERVGTLETFRCQMWSGCTVSSTWLSYVVAVHCALVVAVCHHFPLDVVSVLDCYLITSHY